jgi:hypothetical protein
MIVIWAMSQLKAGMRQMARVVKWAVRLEAIDNCVAWVFRSQAPSLNQMSTGPSLDG